jgi:hypothetical protein
MDKNNEENYTSGGLGIGDLGIGDWAQSPIPNSIVFYKYIIYMNI